MVAIRGGIEPQRSSPERGVRVGEGGAAAVVPGAAEGRGGAGGRGGYLRAGGEGVRGALQPRALPHVLILGAGCGVIYAARALRDAPVGVRVGARRNHHLFQPMLYQVATAGLNPSDIAS